MNEQLYVEAKGALEARDVGNVFKLIGALVSDAEAVALRWDARRIQVEDAYARAKAELQNYPSLARTDLDTVIRCARELHVSPPADVIDLYERASQGEIDATYAGAVKLLDVENDDGATTLAHIKSIREIARDPILKGRTLNVPDMSTLETQARELLCTRTIGYASQGKHEGAGGNLNWLESYDRRLARRAALGCLEAALGRAISKCESGASAYAVGRALDACGDYVSRSNPSRIPEVTGRLYGSDVDTSTLPQDSHTDDVPRATFESLEAILGRARDIVRSGASQAAVQSLRTALDDLRKVKQQRTEGDKK